MDEQRVNTETVTASSPLSPLPYQVALRDYYKNQEPELWGWLSSGDVNAEYTEAVRLDLLKSTYRLDREAHAELYEQTDATCRALGVTAPLTLYQSQDVGANSAAMFFLPGEVHIVLIGQVRTLLSSEEVQAIIGHELAHFLLWSMDDGDYMILDRILNTIVNDSRSEPSHHETARLFQLYSEIFADRGSLVVAGSLFVVVGTLLKTMTGAPDVSPAAYLKQAEEIFSKTDPGTDQETHPEAYIRARATELWAEHLAQVADYQPEEGTSEPDETAVNIVIAGMIQGQPSLDSLDVLRQQQVTEWTDDILNHLLAHPALRTQGLVSNVKLYFPDFTPSISPARSLDELALLLSAADTKLRDYFCYVLLDLVAADPDVEQVALAAAQKTADGLGVLDTFRNLAMKELKQRKRDLTSNLKEADQILAKADAQAAAGGDR